MVSGGPFSPGTSVAAPRLFVSCCSPHRRQAGASELPVGVCVFLLLSQPNLQIIHVKSGEQMSRLERLHGASSNDA